MLGKFLRTLKCDPRPDRKKRPLEPAAEKPKLGLALSSGGARGLAHVGVLQVLEENGNEVFCFRHEPSFAPFFTWLKRKMGFCGCGIGIPAA